MKRGMVNARPRGLRADRIAIAGELLAIPLSRRVHLYSNGGGTENVGRAAVSFVW
jgi:hypothetical protein